MHICDRRWNEIQDQAEVTLTKFSMGSIASSATQQQGLANHFPISSTAASWERMIQGITKMMENAVF